MHACTHTQAHDCVDEAWGMQWLRGSWRGRGYKFGEMQASHGMVPLMPDAIIFFRTPPKPGSPAS